MDGFQFAEAVRGSSRWHDTPLVALSSHATTTDLDQGRKVGFDDYVAQVPTATCCSPRFLKTLSLRKGCRMNHDAIRRGSADAESRAVTVKGGEFVAVTIGGQLFGIPVLEVRDVLASQRITRVPLAPPEVAGSLNLRGRIVTAIDIGVRLGFARALGEERVGPSGMSVVVDHGGELYSLIVDSVGEVLSLSAEHFERNPATLDVRWREVSAGIYRLHGALLVVLDVNRLLDISFPVLKRPEPPRPNAFNAESEIMKSCLIVDDSRIVRKVRPANPRGIRLRRRGGSRRSACDGGLPADACPTPSCWTGTCR